MFKFKMSLFLKSTKFKAAVATLILCAVIAGIALVPRSKAGEISESVAIQADPTGVTVNGRNLYSIKKSGDAVGYNKIFCIEEDAPLESLTYSNPVSVQNTPQFFTNYNSAMWLINNMYISNITGSDGTNEWNAKATLLINLANLLTSSNVKSRVSSAFGMDASGITPQKIFALKDRTIGGENALEVVEQIALWKYTANEGTTVSSAYRNDVNAYFGGTDLSDDEQKTLKYVYYALTVVADDNTNTTPTKNVSNPITLNKNQAKYNETTKKIGPYFIEENGKRWTEFSFGNATEGKLPVSVEITNTDGTTATPGTEIFEKSSDGSIYLNLSSYPNANKVRFFIQYIARGINTDAYVLYGGEKQNLLTIEKSVYAAGLSDTKDIVVEKPSGEYSVVLKKVKADGTTVITSSEAIFKVNGTDYNTSNGILNIAKNKTIENTDQVDQYEISETKAPEGYKSIISKLRFNVYFKEVNKKYIIDTARTNTSGFGEDAQIDISPENATITITVKNTELPKPGQYSVELYKVDENNNIIKTPAKFEVNGEEATTSNGKIYVASNVVVNDDTTVGRYTIRETEAPENYYIYNGTISLDVKMTKEDNNYILKENGITFRYDRNQVTNSMANKVTDPKFELDGSTIKVFVPNISKKFDLSLRKFISKIDGVNVTPSREPVINVQSIINLVQTGTASYYHNKNSLVVTEGSEVEYTIRVYNEGEILGYAKQITDYLPDGLSFLRIADESKNLYTTTSEVGSKEIVLDYKGNTLIKSLRDFISQISIIKKDVKLNVTNEYYQEVKVICKVEKTDATYITSRSEITNYGYTEKDSEGRQIWKEAREIGNVDIDSVQNTISNSLGLDTWYENAKERTYVDESGKSVVDTNYFPGVQDDDDFETVELLAGKYNIIIKKVDAKDANKVLAGASFSVKGSNIDTEVGPTSDNGQVTVVKGVEIKNDKQVDTYTIKETKAPQNYKLYNGEIKVNVATKFDSRSFVIDSEKTTVNGKDVKFSVNKENTTLTIVVPNEASRFDLSLRKFITDINGKAPETSREPQVDVSKLVSRESTTATYNHPKDPLSVNPTDIVTYTIRVYNEGEIDGYANKIMDDIPQGLEYLPENETNKEYGWVMYKEVTDKSAPLPKTAIMYNNKAYVITKDAKEADLIVTEKLSLENGKDNLLKAFDATSKKLDYKDVKVAFKVVEPQTSDRIIINYAQITDDTDSDGNKIDDDDSTTNVWIDTDDDQDIEKIKVKYFDLALRKWVTKAIVYENGSKTVTETNHGPWDDPEEVVKVDLKNTNIDNVEVKFEYSIRVINQGEIEGYAKEISDYIPEGLKFVPGDNPQWVEADGKIVTKALENTLLKPGEYADVTVVLTWINGANNLGLKTNIAEISEDYNKYHVHDIDSTPNNKVKDEDDIDDAPVILTIKTGAPVVYTGVAVAFIAIISLGVVIIRKKVLAR